MRSMLMLLALICFAVGVGAEPREKSVDLARRTKLVVYVVPDLGVRLTFPFVLDETDAYVPLTLVLTNPAFENRREKGRNYFVITSKRDSPAGMLGNLFMNVAGTEVSIELRVTHDLSKHHSDIVFNLTKDAREDLIQKSIAQRSAALEQEHRKKMEELDSIAEKKAIAHVGRLAITKPRVKNVKEEFALKAPGGGLLTLYVDNAVQYDKYSIYLIQLEADRFLKDARILDAKLFEVDGETKNEKPVESFNQLPQEIRSNETVKGSVTILESAINKKSSLKLEVLTDRGSLVVKW